MTNATVTLSQLIPSKRNPRKTIDTLGIEGLAASIKADGLLQNLVVAPQGTSGKKPFTIISGHRRFLALTLLAERGELPDDFAVPVDIREGLSSDDSLRIATVENLQRANLAPLEETAALTKLLKGGEKLEDVVALTGLSVTTIKRRLVLNDLCKEAKAALKSGTITLAQAEALTLGGHDTQRNVLEEIARGYGSFSADNIRATFLDARPAVALAIFPREQYTGTVTTDLFADDETSYFDDAEQFFALQRQAVELLTEDYRKIVAWVEITNAYNVPEWRYDEAEDGEPSGVLINLSPAGEVTVRGGLAKRETHEDAAKTVEHPLAAKSKPEYSAALCRHVAHHKSIAVQEMLLASPRKAKEVAAVHALMYVKPHACIAALREVGASPGSYLVIEAQTRLYAEKLGFAIEEGQSVWGEFPAFSFHDCQLYDAVKQLSDHELDELHVLLTALNFGQSSCDRLDTADSLFNRVARDLELDMRNHWRPDEGFLTRRTREQLISIAAECGYAVGRSGLHSYKKSELVAGLLRHFADSFVAASPVAEQEKARSWLPDSMRFPATDPDAQAEADEELDEATAD